MRLLLVDDEPGIREGLAALLRKKGHEVVTAGDCARAAAVLAEDAPSFELVLTDWRLPDGVADDYLGRVAGPVVAMSGHPEEIAEHPKLARVLTKPVSPRVLLAVIAEFEAGPAPATDGSALPRDVGELVTAATRLIGAEPALEDDGTFVTIRAALPAEAPIDELRRLGGDLRILAPAGVPTIEFRWCRDGRPDPAVAAVRPAASWPDASEFAVDFDGTELTGEEFGRCIDRALEHRRRGRAVHFLNVPDSLLSWASGQGRSDDMPMRTPVGPRLPTVLADLWS